ncbi:MAG: DNA polymerase/3'-5' exonuclease PolX [Candidatus Ancaeobacter aquaticus]|nr:DNA polymerase/3'-5' exonuclease PolX [Candidatus Ancaeobacter aquaticus]
MKNKEIAMLFNKIADILEFKGDVSFRINSYRKAAHIIEDMAEDIEAYDESGTLKEIEGIGESLAKKIDEYIKTGRIAKYEEMKTGVSEELIDLMKISGIGQKTLALIHKKYGVKNIDELEKVVTDGKVRDLFGMGDKKAENILRGIKLYRASHGRISLGIAFPVMRMIIDELKKNRKVKKIDIAGSLRRMQETIGDIDILVCGKEGKDIVNHFTTLPCVKEVLSSGSTRGSVVVEDGIQVDVRVVREDSYGAALQYFTGSKEHSVKLRGIAKAHGYKINEYGIYKGDKKVGGAHESDIYSALGLAYIPPVLRENRGEIEAASRNMLPSLVQSKNVRGDLHVHSNWSDGESSVEDVVRASIELGYEYVAICDHSQSLKVAHGLSPETVFRKLDEIKRVRKKYKDFAILFGTEVDIKSDGSIDYSDTVLKEFDVVIGAVHTGFKDSEEKLTSRILSAINNKYVNIIAHPTGRRIGLREPYPVDLDAIFKAASQSGTFLEINSFYDRLDLCDTAVKRAKEYGVKFALSTDCHHVDQLWMMSLGVSVAQRGWLTKNDVVNCWPLPKLLSHFSSKNKK